MRFVRPALFGAVWLTFANASGFLQSKLPPRLAKLAEEISAFFL
jgi:hypothetical protein